MTKRSAIKTDLFADEHHRKKLDELGERWPRSFGQYSEIFKWNVRGNHAANLIAGSVAKYASSGV